MVPAQETAMKRLNRDVIIAVCLLVMCGVFIAASFDIRQPDYGTLMPSTWPRTVLVLFAALTVIYLIQSLRRPPSGGEKRGGGVKAWLATYRNPLICFALFLAFLVTLPVFGILIGGALFVFVMLTALGGAGKRRLLVHALIAIATVGLMWAVFTFGLHVILPQGMIFTTL